MARPALIVNPGTGGLLAGARQGSQETPDSAQFWEVGDPVGCEPCGVLGSEPAKSLEFRSSGETSGDRRVSASLLWQGWSDGCLSGNGTSSGLPDPLYLSPSPGKEDTRKPHLGGGVPGMEDRTSKRDTP